MLITQENLSNFKKDLGKVPDFNVTARKLRRAFEFMAHDGLGDPYTFVFEVVPPVPVVSDYKWRARREKAIKWVNALTDNWHADWVRVPGECFLSYDSQKSGSGFTVTVGFTQNTRARGLTYKDFKALQDLLWDMVDSFAYNPAWDNQQQKESA